MHAGEFELDEPAIDIGRDGDTFTIRGIDAPITEAPRTENRTRRSRSPNWIPGRF